MKLILSRKGFDSAAGGCPSPILPGGELLSLPIPDGRSRIRYRDIRHRKAPVGRLVSQLSRARHRATAAAHLDPDLDGDAIERAAGWRPILGQTGAAQGHLRRQQVGPGDLFLFFGLFRPVELKSRRWRFVPGSVAKHVFWGWLQVEKVVNVDSLEADALPWARYHPHFHGQADANNTLYLAARSLTLDGRESGLPGAGLFPRSGPALHLTRPEARSPSQWRLPGWFHPRGERPPLSFHHKPGRWQRRGDPCHLQAAARGQEFVLDTAHYPEAGPWLHELISLYR